MGRILRDSERSFFRKLRDKGRQKRGASKGFGKGRKGPVKSRNKRSPKGEIAKLTAVSTLWDGVFMG